jgi:type I restriction enzyme S subunit
MNAETFCEHFATFANAPDGIKKLRHLILQLAVQGKLTTSETSDGSVTVLRREMESARQRMIDAGTIRQGDRFEPVSVDEVPYSLPANWTWVRIGEVMHLINGKAFKPTDWLTAGLPIVRIQNLNNPDAPFNYAGEDVDDKVRLQNDDFLISWSGTPGTSFGAFIWDRGPAVLNQHIFRSILYGEAFIKPFLKLAVNARLDEMIAQAHGGVGLQHITKGKLERLSLPLPPLAEQRRIVEKVDQLLGLCDELAARQAAQREKRQRLVGATLDRLVSTRNPAEFPTHAHRLRHHFDQLFDTPSTIPQLRQTVLKLAVQGQLVPQDANDEPASMLLERARMERVGASDDGDVIDETMDSTNVTEGLLLEQRASWKLVRFAEVISYGPRNGISPKPVNHVTKTKSLTLSATTSGTFDGRHVKYLDEEIPPDSCLWLKDGDILIQRSNSEHYVGVAAIYRGKPNDFVYPDLMMKVRVASCIDIDFAHLVLMSPSSREYFRKRATGTSGSMRKINKTTVKALPFPLPPLAEQKRIVTKVTELLSLCDALESKLTQAESASTQLLAAAVHHLLNGAVTNV